MTTLTQSRALLDFALAQVRHLLPDLLPPKLAPDLRLALYSIINPRKTVNILL